LISFRVVAVPERLERATAIADAVGGEVILDAHRDGAFPTHVKALLSGTGTHTVVVEDDAILCPDFVAHVQSLIWERPDHLLGLYVGRVRPHAPQQYIAPQLGWLDHPGLVEQLWWGVGYVMPTRDIPAVVDELMQGNQHPWVHTDRRIGLWHARRGRLSYPFPSPLDHDDSLPSTGFGGDGRVAWEHCGGSFDA
jgi:hypothetical protein